MTDSTIIITGGSDGIGAEAAGTLKAAGRRVLIVGRSAAKTAGVAQRIGAEHLVADFSRLDDVRELAASILDRTGEISVLANNAGGIFGDRKPTVDGYERTLQVNHLAPFLLTNLLMDRLLESRSAVINTSSIASRLFGMVDLDDLGNERRFSANKAYGDAKLENILFTKGLHRRFRDQGLTSAAFHPGVVRTNFAAETTSIMRFVYRTPLKYLATVSTEQGGRTLRWFIDGEPDRTWRSGEYYEERAHAKRANPQIVDEHLIDGLWTKSAELVGLPAQ